MSGIQGSFQTSLVFVPRKLNYAFGDSNIWTLVLPAQSMKNLRILHDTSFILKSNDERKVIVKVHNAAEYGVEYSFLKPPKAFAAEELLKSLNINANEEVNLIFEKFSDLSNATKVSFRYLETFDLKDYTWKNLTKPKCDDRNTNSKNENHSGSEQKDLSTSNESDNTGGFKKFNWFVSNDDLLLLPPVQWHNSLINGEFNKVIRSSLVGCGLFPGNVVLVSLKGYLCRFLVNSVFGHSKDSSKILTMGLDTEISVSFDLKTNVLSEPQTKVHSEDGKKYPVISGLDEVLETLNTHVFTPLLSQLDVLAPTGVLLYGPPGCGKTLLARTIRDNYQELFGTQEILKFKMVQSTDLVSEFMNKTACNINDLFNELKQESTNCKMVCFIDEIDVLCYSRESFRNDVSSKSALTALLNNMDGLNSSNNNFVVIGMTNYIDSMDNALRRPGRFDLEIEIPVPSSENRLLILKNLLSKVKHDLKDEQIRYINDFCQAFVGADLKLLLTNANHAKLSRLKVQNNVTESSVSQVNGTHVLMFEDFLEALKVTKPSAMRELYVEVPQVRWDDIGGYEDLKRTIKESVEYPRKFSKLYEKLNIQVPKGILLYGPPGCSKTLMAKAICTESHMNFISVKGPELYNKYVGESEKNVRKLFSKARTNSPCVIFFDEIDSLCSDDSESVGKRVLGTLLNEMDGISPLKHVLVVGATNRPQDLSKSLLRPGRFDKLIYVPLPDFEARKAIFTLNLKKLEVDFDLSEVSSKLSSLTDGYSGAEVAGICRQASMYLLSEIIDSIESNRDTNSDYKSDLDNDLNETVLVEKLEKLSLSQARPLSYHHLEKALKNTKPMTSKEMVEFYEEYSKNSLL